MGDGFQALDIILFAALAAFLVFRLRSVLGRRTGHQRRPPQEPYGTQGRESSSDTGRDDNVIELPDRRPEDAAVDSAFETADSDDPIAAGITQIRIADPNFDRNEFLQGARMAFEMVVDCFAKGDTKTLRNLLNDEVFDNFATAIKDREDAGETLETTVIGIKSIDIIDARIDGRMALVTVKFVSEQVNVTKNEDGAIVEGDPNHIAEVTDIWTFARNTRARDPNWTLVETRSPN